MKLLITLLTILLATVVKAGDEPPWHSPTGFWARITADQVVTNITNGVDVMFDTCNASDNPYYWFDPATHTFVATNVGKCLIDVRLSVTGTPTNSVNFILLMRGVSTNITTVASVSGVGSNLPPLLRMVNTDGTNCYWIKLVSTSAGERTIIGGSNAITHFGAVPIHGQ